MTFLISPFLFSLKIDTPELFNKLETGQIEGNHQTIYVECGAHPDVLSLPKRFWNATFQELHFCDGQGNEIVLSPGAHSVQAYLTAGKDLTLGIPSNYEQYFVFFDKEVVITPADIDTIIRWRNAVRLTISDHADLAYNLSKKMNEMRKMQRLRNLTLDVQPSSSTRLSLKQFVLKLPRLKQANFLAPSLTQAEFDKFIKKQQALKGWEIEAQFKMISYHKKSRFNRV